MAAVLINKSQLKSVSGILFLYFVCFFGAKCSQDPEIIRQPIKLWVKRKVQVPIHLVKMSCSLCLNERHGANDSIHVLVKKTRLYARLLLQFVILSVYFQGQ